MNLDDQIALRREVYDLFSIWAGQGLLNIKAAAPYRSRHLRWLLRGEDTCFAYDEITEDEIDICKQLLGSNGYSIYRMLLARRQDAI